MSGIATVYNGIRFRSRLEATWAAFFDRLGWSWEYEPVDLNGYIPDFVLPWNKPLLIEVKPEFYYDDLIRHGEKIYASGWNHESVVVGVSPFVYMDSLCLGALFGGDEDVDPDGPGEYQDGAAFSECIHCKKITVCSYSQSYHCRICGVNEGCGPAHVDKKVMREFAIAKNLTQWIGQRCNA